MKVASIVGARPQFVKATVLSRALRDREEVEAEILIHTGQHYDSEMSDIFFEELGIPTPAHNLGIGSGTHGRQTGRMLEALETVLISEDPDWVVVYGDTNSTLAGALAAVKLNIPVAHVEAGLRSFNREMPEEINRVLTDHASDLLFSPTETSTAHLEEEGIAGNRVSQVGDVMYDAALQYGRLAEETSTVLDRTGVGDTAYALATVHRASNTDDASRLANIFHALLTFAERMPVVLPLHPRTRNALEREGMLDMVERGLVVLEPVGYLDMMLLEKKAGLIVTDSGGVQKEAFFHEVPCVTVRDETEWVELLELGWNRLAPPSSPEAVLSELESAVGSRGEEAQPYGAGDAARRAARALVDFIG